ncbi:MAG: transposon-encoded TnpW family protein [Lachnospiraceae bacterium]|nr:transposon-encoded TnpW family protein [Lachnospiraceae bacterium]
MENKANYIDGGNFKTRIGNTTYLVGVFFNNAKKVTVEDRMKNLIRQEVVAGNF